MMTVRAQPAQFLDSQNKWTDATQRSALAGLGLDATRRKRASTSGIIDR